MRRKALGAILLPLPFAALPVAAVLIGAVFGPAPEDHLVTRDVSTAISVQEHVLTERAEMQADGLAKVSSSSYGTLGCDDHDLRSES